MSLSGSISSNVNATTVNAAQARLPKLSPEFIAQHYPDSAELVHVHLIHRHGERAPSGHHFAKFSPKYWDFCAQGNQLHADFAKAVQLHAPVIDKSNGSGHKWYNYFFKSENRKDDVIVPSASNAELSAATCAFSQLTDVGRQSMAALGAHMRALYMDELGFLPAVLRPGNNSDFSEDFYLRSTSFPRTLESLQYTLGGLYPNIPAKSPLFRINARPQSQENLYPDFERKELEQLHIENAAKSIELFGKEYTALHKEVSQIPSLRDEVEPEPKSKVPHSTYFIWDTVSAVRAHGLPLPKEIDDDFIARVSRMCAVEYMYPITLSAELARMQMGPFIRELADTVVGAIEAGRGIQTDKKASPKMSIYSGHDTTIGPLLALLCDNIDGSPTLATSTGHMWPPFASSLRIELLKDSVSSLPPGNRFSYPDDVSAVLPKERTCLLNAPFSIQDTRDHYVRVWYNDRTVQLPACLDPSAHHSKLGSTVCTLDGFFKQIARFVPSDDGFNVVVGLMIRSDSNAMDIDEILDGSQEVNRVNVLAFDSDVGPIDLNKDIVARLEAFDIS
ncbi:hypothetical protein GGI21_002275 [Coemansia aciculifera]|nr:hypothetical protein GGI21_002275 [Coemansia aciculifera]